MGPAAPRVAHLLTEGRTLLSESSAIDHWRAAIAREDAEDLLALALGMAPGGLDPEASVPAGVEVRYREYLARRAAGEPVALIRGVVDFAGLTLAVRHGVFVPRGSSELLAQVAVAALPSAEVWGLDIDPAAVALSRANARRNRLGNVHFRVSDLVAALPRRLQGEVGALTMHPPYVARQEVRTLPREIRRFEPRHTLTDGSSDGLGLVRDLVEEAPRWLRRGGVLLFEVAPYLSRSVQSLMRRAGLEVTVQADPGGITRVIAGRGHG